MTATRFEDSVTGGNEVNGLVGPSAAQRLEDLFDAVQTEFEKRWSLAYGFFAVPTVTLDEGGEKVDITAIDALLDGERLTTPDFVLMTGKSAGTYYLQASNANAYSVATSQNTALLSIATFAWNPAGTPKLSTLAVIPTSAGINFKGQTAQLSQWIPRGTWTTAFAYRGNSTYRDVVTYNGSCYVAKSDHTSGATTEPGVGASWGTYWQLLASKGAKGDKGDSGGLTVPKGDWLTGTAYSAIAPDTVVGSDGHGYQCLVSHTSGDLDDEPGVGAVAGTYWKRYVNAGGTGATGTAGAGWNPQGAWVTGTAYAITPNIDWVTHGGGSYACILAHTSGASTEPGAGVDWQTYWIKFAEKGAPGEAIDWQNAWATTTPYTVGQGVNRLGSSFYCKTEHTSGASTEPGVGASWTTAWDYLAQKGTDGTPGTDGTDGTDGTNGVDGEDGIGFAPKGPWLTATLYAVTPNIDIVYYLGNAYYCKQAHTSGATSEPTVGANWEDYWGLYLAGGLGAYTVVTSVGTPGTDTNLPTEQAVREAVTTHESAYTHHQDNDAAIVAPGVTNDTSEGYSVGSRWIDTVTGNTYTCVDASAGGAAWEQENGGGTVDIHGATETTDAPDGANDELLVYKNGVGNRSINLNNLAKRKETIVLTAGGGIPATTAGCTGPTQGETATNKINWLYLTFAKDVTSYAHWTVVMPDNWDGGTLTAVFHWSGAAAGDAIWGIQGVCLADNDTGDAAWGTAQEVTDTAPNATTHRQSAATGAITLGGSPGGGRQVHLRVYRKGADASDTIDDAARLVGVKLEYRDNARAAVGATLEEVKGGIMKHVVYLDDGHGADTPGKRTPRFPDGHIMHENAFNAAVVRDLAAILTAHGLTVIQLSPETSDTPLVTRVQRANSHHAALMKKKTFRSVLVSVHANAAGNGATFNSGQGVEVFYYPGRFKLESIVLGRDVLDALVKGTPQANRGLKTASFYMIRKPVMPSILIEGAFMTNRREAALLDSDAFRQECAREIAAGIFRYFGL